MSAAAALVLAAMLQVPPAQDTVVVRVPIPQVEQRQDTTLVTVNVAPVSDSILAGVARAQLALNDALAACACSERGRPDWFYAGVLTLGTLFLYRYWRNSTEEDDAEVMGDEAGTLYVPPLPWVPRRRGRPQPPQPPEPPDCGNVP